MSHSMIHPRTPCITFMVKIHLTPAFRISDIICKSFPSHLLVPIASSLWMTYASISHADIFAWCQITTLQQKQLCTQSTIHAIKLRIITISYSIHSLYHLINGCPTPAVDSAAASAICRPGKHHVAFHSIQPFFHPTSQIQVHALHDLRTTTFPTFAILAAKSSWWSTTPTRPKPVRSQSSHLCHSHHTNHFLACSASIPAPSNSWTWKITQMMIYQTDQAKTDKVPQRQPKPTDLRNTPRSPRANVCNCAD